MRRAFRLFRKTLVTLVVTAHGLYTYPTLIDAVLPPKSWCRFDWDVDATVKAVNLRGWNKYTDTWCMTGRPGGLGVRSITARVDHVISSNPTVW